MPLVWGSNPYPPCSLFRNLIKNTNNISMKYFRHGEHYPYANQQTARTPPHLLRDGAALLPATPMPAGPETFNLLFQFIRQIDTICASIDQHDARHIVRHFSGLDRKSTRLNSSH